jgi:DNA-binding MarR family transcriptional regulator
MKEDYYTLVSFILRGSRKKAIFKSLKEKPKIPKDIANECKISISNVSNALPELIEKGLVVCKNPQDHYYKFYELTKKGKKLIKQLNL